MAMAEIEVFGAGIFGLTVAFCLQRRGAKVRVIEKRDIGAGASGGIIGALAPHTPDNWNEKKQFQFESLIATQDFWTEVDGISGFSSGYGQIGRLMALDTARELDLARLRVESAGKFWGHQAQWFVAPTGLSDGWMPKSETGFIARDTLSARIRPGAACASLAAAIVARGGEVLVGQTTGKGADACVLCTGYEGLLDLSATLGTAIGKGVKGQGILLDFEARNLPQIFARGVHVIAHDDGTVAIGSTNEFDWADATATDEQLDALLAKAIDILPALRGANVVSRWAGVRPRSKRRAPMLGRHPQIADTYIANGGFKIGFGVAVSVGEVMADLILNGHADIPLGFTVDANLK